MQRLLTINAAGSTYAVRRSVVIGWVSRRRVDWPPCGVLLSEVVARHADPHRPPLQPASSKNNRAQVHNL
jgi:hypothetical protein